MLEYKTFLNGNVRLYHGDSREIAPQILEQLANDGFKPNMAICDPPYGIPNRYANAGTVTKGIPNWDIVDKGYWPAILWKILNEYLAFNSSIYAWCSHQQIQHWQSLMPSNWKDNGLLVWHKPNPQPNALQVAYLSDHEVACFFVRGKPPFNYSYRTAKRVQTSRVANPHAKEIEYKRVHEAQKPIHIQKMWIENSTNQDDMVVDLTAGSGSVLAAAILSRRKAIGFELDRANYENAVKWLRLFERRIVNRSGRKSF